MILVKLFEIARSSNTR